jgi:hypothetical protein
MALETQTWTNDTTRAVALVLQNGVYVKNGATTRRYLGSFRTTTVNGQTEDSLLKRYVWNYYNRVSKSMRAVDATATWNYSVASYRQANANAANQLDMVIGASEDIVTSTSQGRALSTGSSFVSVGIGLDSTTVNFSQVQTSGTATSGTGSPCFASYSGFPGVGRHTLTWLELGAAGVTITWYGGSLTGLQSGITGTILG